MVTLEQAKKLHYGQTLYHKKLKNADGSALRIRVYGKVKTWKKDKTKVKVPWKYGLYEHGYLDENNRTDFTLKEPAVKKKTKRKK